MVFASAAVGYVMQQAYGSATPEQFFPAFMGLMVLLFAASGVGNGSTFRSVEHHLRPNPGPAPCWAGPRPSPPTAPSSRRC